MTLRLTLLSFTLVAAGCSDDTDTKPDLVTAADLAVPPDAVVPEDATVVGDAPALGDATLPDLAVCTTAKYMEDLSQCKPAATDYLPRDNGSKNDSWAACISDDNTWHPVGTSTSAAKRTLAFETMAGKLWRNAKAPSMQDFLDARDAYSVAEGIGSRVERRQDIHYPRLPDDTSMMKYACSDAAVAKMYPDRCAGPIKLLPVINDAFVAGIAQTEPRVQAARIEAALIWFFYLSTLSEMWTSGTTAVADLDSAPGYYTATTARDRPTGIAAYVNDLSPETHNRVWDGILAARCWRDLDKDLPAKRTDLYQQASAQTDKAAIRGLALVLRDRLTKLACATGEEQKAHLAFVKLLGGLLDRSARAIDATRADALKAQVGAATAAAVDVAKAQAAIDGLYLCP